MDVRARTLEPQLFEINEKSVLSSFFEHLGKPSVFKRTEMKQ